MKAIELIGSGYIYPDTCITNDDLSQIVDTTDEWISTRTGIKTRYISTKKNTSDLAVEAARKAIISSGINPKEIDLIICATATSDQIMPSTACLIQEKLDLNNQPVMAFDVNAACSGFVYALQIASSLLTQYNCALVIGAETLSKIVDWRDRNTCVLFGDGAGAVLLKASTEEKQLVHFARSIGDNSGILEVQGLSLLQELGNQEEHSIGYLSMDGKEVFRFAISAMQEAIEEVSVKKGISLEEVDVIIPHQANIRIIAHVAKKLKIPLEKFYLNLEEFGNTSAASIAMALAQAIEKEVVGKGMKIILVGFGAGFTYAATLIEL